MPGNELQSADLQSAVRSAIDTRAGSPRSSALLQRFLIRTHARDQNFRMMPHPIRPLLTVACFFAAALAPHAASADFRLCNNSSGRISVSLAYTDGQNWVSEGWWNLKSNACEVLLRGGLAAQFYYVYAMDERGGEWKGKAYMCTRDREFRIDGRDNCLVRGFDRTGFLEIDTGKDAKNWTVQLTDASQQPAGR